MCKLTKNLPIHGYPGRLLDFQNSEARILQGGQGHGSRNMASATTKLPPTSKVNSKFDISLHNSTFTLFASYCLHFRF